MRVRSAVVAMVTLAGAGVLAARGGSSSASNSGGGGGDTTTVTLGYFPNITHATALVGVRKGIFARTC